MDMLVFWHEGSLAQFSVLLLCPSTGLHQDMELLVGCVYTEYGHKYSCVRCSL